jgi:hypothetical protein
VLSCNAPTAFCPSIDADVVALYIMYKTRPKGLRLLRTHQLTEEVVDIFGDPVLCRGDWKAPVNINQFVAAISRLHQSLNQNGSYFDTCDACVASNKENHLSCRLHPGQFLIWRRGNPTYSERVKNAKHAALDMCSGHIVQGSCHLLPSEIRTMRENLLSTGKQEDLQLFCIILTSIYLFLRHDEFHKIEVDDIRPEYSAVESHKIINLCVKVQGKTDKEPQNLILWAYDDCPDLCPVRHLMAYIHLCNIKEGWLFPNLKKRSEARNYGTLLHTLNTRFRQCVNRPSITTHSFRKTGYLFAIWGDSDLETARLSARHADDVMASRYAGCARYLLQTATYHNANAKYQVGRFKMAINLDARSARTLNEDTSHNFQNLFQLSQLFLEQVGLGILHAKRKTQKAVLDAALAFQPESNIQEELQAELKMLSEEKRDKLNSIFSRQQQSLLREVRKLQQELGQYKSNLSTVNAPTGAKSDHPASSEELTTSNNKRKRRGACNMDNASTIVTTDQPSPSEDLTTSNKKQKRGGADNLNNARTYLKNAKGMPRLEYLVQLRREKSDMTKLTESARTFMNTAVVPVLKCLEIHHNNDMEKFLEKWPLTSDRGHTKFRLKHCNCKGPVCGII